MPLFVLIVEAPHYLNAVKRTKQLFLLCPCVLSPNWICIHDWQGVTHSSPPDNWLSLVAFCEHSLFKAFGLFK